ncbi:LysM peptidoglycan-binding domain-containing protein [Marichromatium bheemlicum]|uniref:LysM peptidoglycan-binding domain-containing protein n=1 Tax=Marichromatium bheemlicum TaxID=365339 RepID=A0ABX1I3N7_9GAMM|nr:LysM peptidoglycan-binding domain-containing protein [Marichromatium bheemlicum]NKN31673.1 LysM peptidoglycan-binding domain-containing protein [Marichromatium bheemlicum]
MEFTALRNLVLALGALGTAVTVTATPIPTDPSPPATATGPRIDALEAHIEGMQDKLRESAGARKAADQARMEAERRLAASIQTIEQLRYELARVEDARNALSEALRAQAQAHLDAVARLAEVRTDTQQLDQLYRRLPPALGGTLGIEEARAAATTSYQVLVETLRQPARGAARQIEHDAASTQLQIDQALLAVLTEASGLYRVRENDSLALISRRVYGPEGRWQALFEANRHLLDDPDRLTPGMTLVLP